MSKKRQYMSESVREAQEINYKEESASLYGMWGKRWNQGNARTRRVKKRTVR
jgi:hypothetical protein